MKQEVVKESTHTFYVQCVFPNSCHLYDNCKEQGIATNTKENWLSKHIMASHRCNLHGSYL